MSIVPINHVLKREIIIKFGNVKAFANVMGVSDVHVRNVINGTAVPNRRTMYAWANVLGVGVNEIWKEEEVDKAKSFPLRTEIGIIEI